MLDELRHPERIGLTGLRAEEIFERRRRDEWEISRVEAAREMLGGRVVADGWRCRACRHDDRIGHRIGCPFTRFYAEW